MFCHKCGAQISDGSVFCPKCGTKVISAAANQQADVPIPVDIKQQQTNESTLDKSTKKKLGKLPLILGVVVLIMIGIAVIAVKVNKRQSPATVASEDIVLSETYTNDGKGISFNYPAGWMTLDPSSVLEIVHIIDSENNPDRIASLEVSVAVDKLGVLAWDEASARETIEIYGDSTSFLGLWDTSLNGIPAKCVMYQTEGLNVDNIVKEYWYIVGEDTHTVICTYSVSVSDIYEPIFDAIMDSYTITYTGIPDESAVESTLFEGEILYKDIPISAFFDFPADDIAEAIGLPLGEDQDDDIRLYISDIGEMSSAEIWNMSALTIDGTTLNRNRDGLAQILGEPYEEGYGSGYSMRYYFPTYSIYFELGEPDSVAWRASIFPSGDEESTFSYDTAAGFSRPLEYYDQLSGLYEGSTGQQSLSISIFSSQEEGETAIGTVWMYVGDEQNYLGEIIAEPEPDVYLVETDEGGLIVLDVYPNYGPIFIDLYVDGQYIDEYTMVEHYVS